MQKDKLKVFISDWYIPDNCILALVYKGSLFVVDEFSVESSSPAGSFGSGKPTDRYIVVHSKLDYSRYSMSGFELEVDGKVRNDVLWFSLKKSKGSYVIDSPYLFVDSCGVFKSVVFFVLMVITVGLASFILLSLYRKSLVRSSRILRMMKGKMFEMVTSSPAYQKVEKSPSVFTAKDFDMEMNFQDYLDKNPPVEETKSSESPSVSETPSSDSIILTQSAFVDSPSSSESESESSPSTPISSFEPTPSPDTVSEELSSLGMDNVSLDANYSVSESSLPISMESEQTDDSKTTTKKRTTRRKKSSV